jgi:hypothetical protein
MPHIHIFLQELDLLYNAGDLDQYEQFWKRHVSTRNAIFQVSLLPMRKFTTQALIEYLMAQCSMC